MTFGEYEAAFVLFLLYKPSLSKYNGNCEFVDRNHSINKSSQFELGHIGILVGQLHTLFSHARCARGQIPTINYP